MIESQACRMNYIEHVYHCSIYIYDVQFYIHVFSLHSRAVLCLSSCTMTSDLSHSSIMLLADATVAIDYCSLVT